MEDEAIVARDIQQLLVELGYEPVGHATRGEPAIVLAGQLRPDLVLIDIQLAGAMDGIAAAQAIRDQFSLPVVFLTAFADENTLTRAKLTESFGYILKPFSERELRIVIEMGLYKHQAELKLRRTEERLRLVLLGSTDGVWDRDLIRNEAFYSTRWWEMLGYAPDEWPVRADLSLSLIHPDDAARAAQCVAVAQAGETSHYELEVRMRHKAGHYVLMLERGLVVRDAKGQAIRVAGTSTDLTARQRIEEQGETVRRSLREKETLLREIHHRVKNNLQIISSLLYFQAGKVDDPATHRVLNDARDRLRSMILVHEKLYSSGNFADVDFADYVRALVDQLTRSPAGESPRHVFTVETVPLRLPIETALPAGMILVELVTNVLKYAFPGDRIGETIVRVGGVGGPVSLMVSDNGVGLPPSFDPSSTPSFGWQLIRNLVQQLDGAVTFEREAGTKVTISFPSAHSS